MTRVLVFSFLASVVTAAVPAPAPPPAAGEQAQGQITIHLERDRNGHAEPVRTDHVFETGDIIRFRVRAAKDGYLYVLDQGSSGSYTTLFPAPGAPAGNRIEGGKSYSVPMEGDGWFGVDPPAGFDIVYFLLSPTPLAPVTGAASTPVPAPSPGSGSGSGSSDLSKTTPGSPPSPPLNPALKPRCNDAVFQARGECIDSTAGPAPLARDAVLPPQITLAAPHASRDIVLVPEEDGTAVAATATGSAPVVYTFRLAHR